jgi:hypothetical protein
VYVFFFFLGELCGVLETIQKLFSILQVMSVREMWFSSRRKFMKGSQSSLLFFFIYLVCSLMFHLGP